MLTKPSSEFEIDFCCMSSTVWISGLAAALHADSLPTTRGKAPSTSFAAISSLAAACHADS